jgi:hypothetical protein
VKFVTDWYSPVMRQLTHVDYAGDLLTVSVIEGDCVHLRVNDQDTVCLTKKQWAKLSRKVGKELDLD